MSNVIQQASSSGTAPHPWRAHWSQPTLAGKKIVIGYKVDKWARQSIAQIITQEQGELVEDVAPEVDVVIVMRVASGARPAKPSAAEKAAEKLNKAGAAIEVLEYADFFGRLIASPSEAVEMLRAGPAALDRWEQFYQTTGSTKWLTVADADLRDCRLADFPLDRTMFERVDWRGAQLTGATSLHVKDSRFDGADLTNARIVELVACSLVGVHAPGLQLLSGRGAQPAAPCDYTRGKLPFAIIHGLKGGRSQFREADLSDAYIYASNLDGADFSRATLVGASLLQTSAENAVFAGADLRGVHCRGESFKGADFRGADLRGATFYSCDLLDAQFDDAQVEDVNFIESKVTSGQLSNAQGTPRVKREPVVTSQTAAMQPALLQRQRVDVRFIAETPHGRRYVAIMKDNHSGPQSRFLLTITTPAKDCFELRHEVISRGRRTFDENLDAALHYLGPQATLLPETICVTPEDAGLFSLILNGLCEAFGQTRPTVEQRLAATAELKKRSDALKETLQAELRAGEAGVQAFNARRLGDLEGLAPFHKVDLSKAQLDGLIVETLLDFDGAKLNAASLVNVRFNQARLRKARFRGATIRETVLHGQLSGAEFKNAMLEHVDFRKAVLDKTNFTGAKLIGCRFSFANLCGADLSQAECTDCVWIGAHYNERTRLPAGFTQAAVMRWVGQGSPPHVLAAERQQAEAALATAASAPTGDAAAQRATRREIFMRKVKQNVDKAKIDRALKMLKADKFELFVETQDDHLVGVVKSQSDPDLVYACRLASDGSYQCCTQNLNVCGGLRGSPCKHLLVLAIGLERNDAVPPEKLGLWIASSRDRQSTLDKEKMGEVLLRYKGAQAGELDWRPTETTPEDFYAF